MSRPKSEAEVRKALARELRHEPDVVIWEQLCEDRYVAEVIDGLEAEALGDLVSEYRRFEAFARRKLESATGAQSLAGETRLRFGAKLAPLEQLVALEAAREEGVTSFREQVLDGRLLASCDAAELETSWFLPHVRGSRRLSGWSHAPSYSPRGREGVRPTLAAAEAALRGYIAGEPQLPAYDRKDNELDFLLCLVSCLMAWYGWPDGIEVERFVLCGETPHLLFAFASWLPSERFAGRLGRIAIEVNQATSPAELSRFYKSVRELFAERQGMPRRFRACGQLATDLALHVARYNDGRRWAQMLALWNEAHPQDPFADARVFSRRARDAYQTLCGEALDYRGGKQGRDLLRTHNAPPPAAFTPLRADESPTS